MTEPVRDYELKAFLAYVIAVLERLEIPYMVVGGFAAIVYGEPRLTIDVDIVVDMPLECLRPFVAAFPIPEYYASEEGIFDSLTRRYPFNVIHSLTGAKVDLVPLPDDPFSRAAFQRRQRVVYDAAGHSASLISVEDIVTAKLIAYGKTGSDKHLRDALGVLLMQWDALDLDTIRWAAERSGMAGALDELLAEVRRKLQS